jgi:hypothetical protein
MRDSELTALGAGSLGALALGIALIPLRGVTSASNFAFAFMALVILTAEWGGANPAIATALTSALSLDFFLTEPYLRLEIAAKDDLVAFAGLAFCGLLVAGLARRRQGNRGLAVATWLGVGLLATAPCAMAQEPSPAAAPTPAPRTVSLTGYFEAFYSWNFNRPGNDVTAFRGFDNRHDTITISNAVLDAAWSSGRVSGRVGDPRSPPARGDGPRGARGQPAPRRGSGRTHRTGTRACRGRRTPGLGPRAQRDQDRRRQADPRALARPPQGLPGRRARPRQRRHRRVRDLR